MQGKLVDFLRRMARARMADWAVAALLLTLLVWLMAPQQMPVTAYKLSLVALAGLAGYWIDRSLFPYARPDLFFELHHGAGDAPQETTFTDIAGVVNFAEKEAALNLERASSHDLLRLAGTAMLRRAVIVAATMLAVGLGA